MNIESLMSPKPLRWQDEALCEGDERFTGKYEWLASGDLFDMAATCHNCPVIEQCADWAAREQVIEVFAAGYWRSPDGCVTESD